MKIAVIADDLTGAAEIADAAARDGLSAEIQIGRPDTSDADVIVVDADSRLQSTQVASVMVSNLTRQASERLADFIEKKVALFLRGPVLAELSARQPVLATKGRAALRAVVLASGTHLETIQWVTRVAADNLSTWELDQVWMEGDRVVSRLIRESGIEQLTTVTEIGVGVVASTERINSIPLSPVKPESYPWPPATINASSMVPNGLIREMVCCTREM